jgi:hypothetical protein
MLIIGLIVWLKTGCGLFLMIAIIGVEGNGTLEFKKGNIVASDSTWLTKQGFIVNTK